MSRSLRFDWLRRYARPKLVQPHRRKLRLELLEERRLLAGVTVDNNSDAINGDTTSIVNLIATPGGDGISLREAILAVNATAGVDDISFAESLSGQTILLGGTELVLTEALTIDAAPLAQNVTINAQQASRVFNITATSGDFTLAGLTLSGGNATANFLGGGAIRSNSAGNVTLTQSIVSGNQAKGTSAGGGGIFAKGTITLNNSTVSGNSTAGNYARGGGIYADNVTLTQSTVSGNSTTGNLAHGSGIFAIGNVTLTQSTVSGNITTGTSAWGGGIFTSGNVTLTKSTISGNSTAGSGAHAGGIFAGDNVTLIQSTVSGNHATGTGSVGGGVFQNNTASNSPLSIGGSVIAGNTAAGGTPDLRPDPGSLAVAGSISYSLIGETSGSGVTGSTGPSNLLNQNPLLGPLAAHGGPTKTHALLPGSPAIDASDPAITTGLDQRGFARVIDGDGAGGPRIDMGAYESQGIPSYPEGDYNHDGIANAADYVLWRDNFTAFGGNPTGYNLWRANFGNTTVPVTPPGSGASSELLSATDSASGIADSDSAMAEPVTPEISGRVSVSRRSSVALNHTPSASNDKRMLLAFDQALEELDEEHTDARWFADGDDSKEEPESELALAAAFTELW